MSTAPGSALAARIDGLDVARAVAVLGMVAAHIGDEGTRGDEAEGWGWLVVSHGFPSALFAVLAGVSMTLMVTRRGSVRVPEVDADHLRATRVRIAVRGAILILLGLVLEALGTFVAIILTNLGVMFLLALPILTWSRRMLLAVAAVLVASGAWIARELEGVAEGAGVAWVPVLDTFWDHRYPAFVWMAYIAVGLVLGRMDLRADATAGRLALVGVGLAAAARAGGYLLEQGLGAQELWLSTESHSYTPVEMVQNMGVAMAVLGGCLWLTRRTPRLLWPLRAAGSMALTLYTLQILVIAAVGNEIITEPSNVSLVALCVGLVVFAVVWRAFAPQGPLERVLTDASHAAVAHVSQRGAARR